MAGGLEKIRYEDILNKCTRDTAPVTISDAEVLGPVGRTETTTNKGHPSLSYIFWSRLFFLLFFL
jgi:hypothetical protein